jgi:ApbE superfamily uncharacterized protein (UPF0280 family)
MAGVRTRTIQQACATAVAHQVGYGRATMLCVQVFLYVFSDMLQARVSSVSVVSDVCFNCFIRMLQK